MPKEFYFVSDLHFGGDGSLMICDYTEEFVEFLQRLAANAARGNRMIAFLMLAFIADGDGVNRHFGEN